MAPKANTTPEKADEESSEYTTVTEEEEGAARPAAAAPAAAAPAAAALGRQSLRGMSQKLLKLVKRLQHLRLSRQWKSLRNRNRLQGVEKGDDQLCQSHPNLLHEGLAEIRALRAHPFRQLRIAVAAGPEIAHQLRGRWRLLAPKGRVSSECSATSVGNRLPVTRAPLTNTGVGTCCVCLGNAITVAAFRGKTLSNLLPAARPGVTPGLWRRWDILPLRPRLSYVLLLRGDLLLRRKDLRGRITKVDVRPKRTAAARKRN